jgi:uncharacterized damage-inducible protein DinB
MESGIVSADSGEGHDFSDLVARELDRLAREIEAYDDEAELWVVRGAQKNSAGTLALHVCGFLHHFIGAALGQNGYLRDRPAEFSDRVSRAELLERIEHCSRVVTGVLDELDIEVLEAEYPGEAPARMAGIRTRPFLVHLVWHLGWHLGHIYYHRLGGRQAEPA